MAAFPSRLLCRCRDGAWALEALLCLGLARLAIGGCPFRLISRRLGVPGAAPGAVDPGHLPRIRRVAWALEAAARRAPWDCTCLVRALAGRAMLHRRGIPSALYLGLDGGAGGPLQAHAWLACGDLRVTGGAEQDRFTSVAVFMDTRP